jgi:hypothetical protein
MGRPHWASDSFVRLTSLGIDGSIFPRPSTMVGGPNSDRLSLCARILTSQTQQRGEHVSPRRPRGRVCRRPTTISRRAARPVKQLRINEFTRSSERAVRAVGCPSPGRLIHSAAQLPLDGRLKVVRRERLKQDSIKHASEQAPGRSNQPEALRCGQTNWGELSRSIWIRATQVALIDRNDTHHVHARRWTAIRHHGHNGVGLRRGD